MARFGQNRDARLNGVACSSGGFPRFLDKVAGQFRRTGRDADAHHVREARRTCHRLRLRQAPQLLDHSQRCFEVSTLFLKKCRKSDCRNQHLRVLAGTPDWERFLRSAARGRGVSAEEECEARIPEQRGAHARGTVLVLPHEHFFPRTHEVVPGAEVEQGLQLLEPAKVRLLSQTATFRELDAGPRELERPLGSRSSSSIASAANRSAVRGSVRCSAGTDRSAIASPAASTLPSASSSSTACSKRWSASL